MKSSFHLEEAIKFFAKKHTIAIPGKGRNSIGK